MNEFVAGAERTCLSALNRNCQRTAVERSMRRISSTALRRRRRRCTGNTISMEMDRDKIQQKKNAFRFSFLAILVVGRASDDFLHFAWKYDRCGARVSALGKAVERCESTYEKQKKTKITLKWQMENVPIHIFISISTVVAAAVHLYLGKLLHTSGPAHCGQSAAAAAVCSSWQPHSQAHLSFYALAAAICFLFYFRHRSSFTHSIRLTSLLLVLLPPTPTILITTDATVISGLFYGRV